MNIRKLIIQSFRFFFWKNMTVAIAVAIATAVITGALIVGDSVIHSLQQGANYRLGEITHAITAGDQYFTRGLADRMNSEELKASAALQLKGSASASGGKLRLNKVQVWGVDDRFDDVTGTISRFDSIPENEVMVSRNFATRMNLEIGSSLVLKMEKASLMPLNTPFVAADDQLVSRRVTVAKILETEEMGRFGLRNSQTAPFNVFVSIDWLNELMELEGRANHVFLKTSDGSKLEEILSANTSLEDIGIILNASEDNQQIWVIGSEQVFIDDKIADVIASEFNLARPILTYFANSIQFENKSVPYSFVSTYDEGLKEDRITINSWLADDLNASIGDTLKLEYFVIGPLRDLETKSIALVVDGVFAVENQTEDQKLVPEIPGLSDTEKCSEWETGIPIDLESIRDKDEEYWYTYGATPKAFINLTQAKSLWSNRFGSLTGFTLNGGDYLKNDIDATLRKIILPETAGFKINPVKQQAAFAAKNGTDFSSLFIGLSFFIIVSGLLLTSLLFLLNIEQRRSQIGHLSALGFNRKTIRKIYLSEGFIVAVIGTVLGLLLALAYNKLVFYGLNRVWQDIVRTDVLEVLITAKSLVIGFVVSLLMAVGTMWISLNRMLKRNVVEMQKKQSKQPSRLMRKIQWFVFFLMTGAALGLLGTELSSSSQLNAGAFFGIGGLLLIAAILFANLLLLRKGKLKRAISSSSLAYSNLKRNRTRSLMVILLLSIGSFLVVSTGANRKDLFLNASSKTSGTGAYSLMAESTIPILEDLNKAEVRQKYDLNIDAAFVQFRVHAGDDASCLNLNRISNARIIAVDPNKLEGRFSFATKTEDLNTDMPWSSLQTKINEFIPAIADQTVIQWGLGKKVGDTLTYLNEAGEQFNLLLIGGLAGSVFQGNIIIDESLFLEEFPSHSGTSWFLIEGEPAQQDEMQASLIRSFRDYGFEVSGTAEKLAEFKTVENTYLTIFLVLGALGLLLGTIGLAIVLARSILERSKELAVMIATGIPQSKIIQMLLTEYGLLVIYSILAGTGTALLAVLPALLSVNIDISLSFILWLIVGIITNALLWVWVIALVQIRRLKVIGALRNE